MEEIESVSLVVIVLEASAQHPDLDMATPPKPGATQPMGNSSFWNFLPYGGLQ